MSGLICYFKDLLPNVQNIDYDRTWQDLTQDEQQLPRTTPRRRRHDPNSTAATPTTAPLQSSNNPLFPSKSPVTFKTTTDSRNTSFTRTKGELSFSQWEKINRQILRQYWGFRFLTPKQVLDDDNDENPVEEEASWYSDDSSDNEERGQQEQKDDEIDDDDMHLGTQPQLPSLQQQNDAGGPRSAIRPCRRRRIPPLHQAIYSISNVEYLNLYTQDLSVELAQVTKVWRLRSTTRGKHYGQCSACRTIEGRIPRCLFGDFFQDDGPVSSSYDHVLAMEMEPLFVKSDKVNNRPWIYAHRPKSHLRIFFYNAYAKAVAEWMEDQSLVAASNKQLQKNDDDDDVDNPQFIMSLGKIPAISVFPYALDPQDWWEQHHLLDYCVCVGDDSHMKRQPTGEPIRLDAPQMTIRLASTATTAAATFPRSGTTITTAPFSELILSPSILQGPVEEVGESATTDEDREEDALLQTWRNYRKSKQLSSFDTATTLTEVTQGAPATTTTMNLPAVTSTATKNAIAANVPQESSTSSDEPILPPDQEVYAPKGRPPPPSPVLGPIEPMIFEGSAVRRIAAVNAQQQTTTTKNNAIAYHKLAALKNLAKRIPPGNSFQTNPCVNTFGVVLGYTTPSQTKRGDWMCQCTLVDETCTIPITLLIFTNYPQHLPQFERMGDVLRLHRVSLGQWKDEAQLAGIKCSSFVVIRRAPSTTSWEAIPTATTEYSFDQEDVERSQSLWYWGQRFIQEQPTMMHVDHKLTIGDMGNLGSAGAEENNHRNGAVPLPSNHIISIHDRDLTVMVTASIPYPESERLSTSPCGFLRVWDGTGHVHSDPPNFAEAQHNQRKGDPPPDALVQIASIILEMNQKENVTEKLRIPEALCGKVANAIIWEPGHWDLILKHVPVGSFLRIRNVDVRPWKNNSFSSFMVHSKSWLSPLPNQCFEIQSLLKEHDLRVRRNEYNPKSGLLPGHVDTSLRRDLPRATTATAGTTITATSTGNAPVIRASLPPTLSPVQGLGHGLASFVQVTTSADMSSSSSHQRRRKRRRKDSTYRGVVRLLNETTPAFTGNLKDFVVLDKKDAFCFRLAIKVTDASSATLPVIVDHVAAERIIGVTATQAVEGHETRERLWDPQTLWIASIVSIFQQGQLYFLLKQVERQRREIGISSRVRTYSTMPSEHPG